jgi:hypothetical protein
MTIKVSNRHAFIYTTTSFSFWVLSVVFFAYVSVVVRQCALTWFFCFSLVVFVFLLCFEEVGVYLGFW